MHHQSFAPLDPCGSHHKHNTGQQPTELQPVKMPIRGPVNVKLHKKDATETLRIGPVTVRIFEDGSLTENRVSSVLVQVPAGKSGPPMHWHRFHDEMYFVTKGKSSYPVQAQGKQPLCYCC